TRIESADLDHARLGDVVAQCRHEPPDLRRVLADGAEESGVLGLGLADVFRELAESTRQDAEIVVAVELELGEELGHRGAGAGRRLRPAVTAAVVGRDAWIVVLGLEASRRPTQARAARAEEPADAVELGETLLEPTVGDHELAHEVHQRVEAIETDSDAR